MRRYLLFSLPILLVLAAAVAYVFQPSSIPHPSLAAEITSHSTPPTSVSADAAGVRTATEAEAAQMGEMPKLMRELVEMQPGIDRRQKVERFGFDAAKKDPEAALLQVAALHGSDRAAYLRGMFEQFSTLPPADALKWAKRLKAGPDRDLALAALAGTWRSGAGISLAEEAKMIDRYGVAGALGFRFLDAKSADPELAALWADQVAGGRAQADLLGDIAAKLAQTDPTKALALGADLKGNERAQFLRKLAGGLAEKDPESAWQWATQLADAGERAAVEATLLRDLARQDGAAALQKIKQMPEGEDRNRATTMATFAWAGQNPEAAAQWAEAITDPAQKQAAQTIVQRATSNSLGVTMKVGADGYPVVSGFAANAPAGQNSPIQPNQKIVAVANAEGQMIDTKGLTLQQLAEQVRGRPGTPVKVQVTSETDSTPRTVEVNRTRGGGGQFPSGGGGGGGGGNGQRGGRGGRGQ